jgi:hypothetical protein
MATFPLLKTDAVAQYPAKRTLRCQNQAVRFLDGSEQRYRDSAGPLRRWEIQLNQLDEREMAAIEQFFADNQGRFATFTFTDPWTGVELPNCSIEGDELELTMTGEMRGTATVAIVENRA